VIKVSPEQSQYVEFDVLALYAIAEKAAADAGLSDAGVDIEVDIDDASPLTRVAIESFDGPIVLKIDGGALEDPTNPRHLSDVLAPDVIGRLLLRCADRRSGRFDDAPPEVDLSLQEQIAWDVHAVGRLGRLGHAVQEPRRRYQFRTRHGFTDVADRAFDRLWNADSLAWSDIASACAGTEAERAPAASAASAV
jgi:hypothetical protein